jgi:hypothetical protein
MAAGWMNAPGEIYFATGINAIHHPLRWCKRGPVSCRASGAIYHAKPYRRRWLFSSFAPFFGLAFIDPIIVVCTNTVLPAGAHASAVVRPFETVQKIQDPCDANQSTTAPEEVANHWSIQSRNTQSHAESIPQ